MKTFWGLEVILHVFENLAVGGGAWSASCLSCLITGKKSSVTHWRLCWVGPVFGMGTVHSR